MERVLNVTSLVSKIYRCVSLLSRNLLGIKSSVDFFKTLLITTMKIDSETNEELVKLQTKLVQRDKDERQPSATLTSETLSLLNLSIGALPQRCQQLLRHCAALQVELNHQLDSVAISVRTSKEISARLTKEFELLELKQKNAELQKQIDRNNIFIEELKTELQSSKDSLANQNPNPDNILDHVKQMKNKLVSYEDMYEKAKTKFTKLHVTDAVLPKSLEELAIRLASLRVQEEDLRQRAETITLAREARDTLSKLSRV